MKKIICLVFSMAAITMVYGQKISGKLKFGQGQNIQVITEAKTTLAQEAMGQVIDFSGAGTATHTYTVTNATDDNSTLNHKMQRIIFTFDGMGRKMNFDSDNPQSMNGQFGKPVKEMLDKTYNMIVDTCGKVLMVMPEKFEAGSDERLMIIASMLKDVLGVVQPPKKGEASFFGILPGRELNKGDSWNDTTDNESEKGTTTYTLTEITDSTLVIDLAGNSTSVSKAEFMGMQTITNLTNKITGKIIIDRVTNIVREKNAVIDSKGTTEAMGGAVPVTSKTFIVIKVLPTQ